jgi:hypothetical protein
MFAGGRTRGVSAAPQVVMIQLTQHIYAESQFLDHLAFIGSWAAIVQLDRHLPITQSPNS